MNRQMMLAMIAVGVGFSSAARASEWGTLEGAHLCDQELAAAKASPDQWKWIDEAVKTGKGLSPQCKAELDKRMQTCLKDPGMSGYLNDRSITKGDPNHVCYQHAFGGMGDQITNAEAKKKQEAEAAKAKEAEQAKRAAEVAARELPKTTKHDAKLEKAVADAYHRDYPEGKVLKVILGSWSDDYEKDAFNRVTGRDLDATVVNKQPDGKCFLHGELWMQHGNGRSFSGPLSARGAGSASDQEISCTKAEVSAPQSKKK